MILATVSVKPRTALTGVPSGAVIDWGTPKNARKYRLAESSSTRVTPDSLPGCRRSASGG